jgi:DHA2 family multidrug resistance protein
VRSIVPTEALTIGCLLQLSRLFGGEIGTAFMQTFVRVREQIHSNIIGQHVAVGAALATDRLSAYAGNLATHAADAGLVSAQAYRLLTAAIAGQANVLAYQDGLIAASMGAALCMLLVALMRPGRPSPF